MDKSEFQIPEATEVEAVLEKLRRDESLYEASECAAKIGHYRWNTEQDRLETCSQAYARIFEMSVEAVIEAQDSWDSLIELVHPDDRERYIEIGRDTRVSGYLDTQYRILLPNGEIRQLREIGICGENGGQTLKCKAGIIQDITLRTGHGDEIERYYKLMGQAEYLADIGHYIYDEDKQNYIYVSEGFARIHGTTAEQHMQRVKCFDDDLDEIVDADRDRVAEAYRHYITTGEDLDVEYRITRADGELRWLREMSQAQCMQDGWVMQTIGVLQDITRHKQNENELRYKDALANQAETITEIGHFVYDEIADKYLFVSPGLAKIYGVDADYLLHHLQSTEDDMEFVHEDDREAVLEFYDAAELDENGYEEWDIEFRMVRPGGEIRWVREIGQTKVLERGVREHTIGVLIDITAQKIAEQKLVEARDELECRVEARTRELAVTIERLQREIREREKLTAEIHFLANHDAMTGLPGLHLGRDRIQQALADARRRSQLMAVMYLDLDGFKQVNDDYGHEAGDSVLQAAAGRLKAEVRDTDTVARVGGDEFLVVLSGMPSRDQVQRIAAKLVRAAQQEIMLNGSTIRIAVSIGIALYPEIGATVDELFNAANKAMYEVKERGKNGFGFAGSGSGKPVAAAADMSADASD